MKSFLFFFFGICCVATNTFAQRETFDMLTYTVPPGWQTVEKAKDHMTYLLNRENKSGFAKIIVYQGRAGNKTPIEEFKSEWSETIKRTWGNDYVAAPTINGPDNGWTAVTSGCLVQPASGSSFLAMLTAITGHGKTTSVVALMLDTAYYQPHVAKFFDSIEPVTIAETQKTAAATSYPAPTAISPVASVPQNIPTLHGMWVGLGKLTLAGGITNASGTGYAAYYVSSSIQRNTIAFFPDGSFCGVLPSAGLDVDHAKMKKEYPYYWGSYSFANGAGTISIAGQQYPFTFDGKALNYGGVKFDWHYVSQDNLHFDGTFTCERDAAKWSQEVTSEPTLTFTAAGRFTDTGAIHWMRHVRGYTPEEKETRTGSGTYEIKNFTMNFKYDDGRRISLTLIDVGGDDKKHPVWVRFERAILDRK